MTTGTPSALSMLTDCFSSDDIEATTRRTGFVKRASKLTGKLFLALVTFGTWSDATTTLAQLAAKVTHLDEQVEVSPEAIHQRMNQRTLALFPGSGGSAAKAGAQIQAVWDYKSSVFGHFVLTPWNMPDQKYVDQVIALAQKGALFIFDLGYFKIQALARLALVGAYFLTRLNHQTKLFTLSAGGMHHVALTQMLRGGAGNLIERDIFIGAKELVPSRLVAVRMPEPIVNERRRVAKKKAKKKGYMPSKAHLNLLAWNLFISNVPSMIWKTTTVAKVYPLRWQIEVL